MNGFKRAVAFIVKSSADPRKASLAVKGYGTLLLTVFTAQLLPAIKIGCAAGYLCSLTDPALLSTITNAVELVGDIAFYALMTVSVVAAFYGTVRKAWTLLNGTNAVLHDRD